MAVKAKRKMVTFDEAPKSRRQHTHPCCDCPFSRDAFPGWLAGLTAEEYCALAHSEALIECHAINGPQCAGAAIYRANVEKKRISKEILVLPANRRTVFSTPIEFIKHHKRKK